VAKKQKYKPPKINDYADTRFRQVARMCFGKRIFKTEKRAQEVGDLWGHTPYECPQCRQWHLTSQKPPVTDV
jgi:hypothetical protein